jgi:hypothetical protein
MKTLLSLLLVAISSACFGQFDPNYKSNKSEFADEDPSPLNAGIGLGLSYGGVGGRLSYFPHKNIGLFGAAGYNFHKLGYNFGLTARFLPDKKVCPVAMLMYGYNAVIVVAGATQYDKTYYGPSVGGGVELRLGHNGNFMNFELLVPFRSQEYHDDMDALMSNPTVEISELLPITISIGYHFRMQ